MVSFYYAVINYGSPSEITGWDEQIEESYGFCPNLFGFGGWTPSLGTIVISPAAELGKHITWLSLLQGAGLVLGPLALMKGSVCSDL